PNEFSPRGPTMKRRGMPALFVVLLLAIPCKAQVHRFEVTVAAGKHDYKWVPVRVPITVPEAVQGVWYAKLEGKDLVLHGQVSNPGILTQQRKAAADGRTRELHFILPSLKAGTSVTLRGSMDPAMPEPPTGASKGLFIMSKQYADLVFQRGGKQVPLVRYMHE